MSLHPFLALPLLLLLGCPADPDKPDDDTGFHEGCDDQDGDGFCTGEAGLAEP